MALPIIASSTSNITNGTATSLTLTKPSGVVNGDLLLLLCGNENSAGGEGFDTLTGWTLEFNYGSADVDTYIGLYSRIATGDPLEDAPVVPFLGADDGHGWYLRVTGVHATDPLRIVGASTEIVSNTITIPALTTDINPFSLAMSTISFDGSDSDPVTETGTGWTLQAFLESPIGDAGGASSGIYSTKPIATASTTTLDSILNMGGGQSDGIVGAMFIIAGTDSPIIHVTVNATTSTGTFTTNTATAIGSINVLVSTTASTASFDANAVIATGDTNIVVSDVGVMAAFTANNVTVVTTENIIVSPTSNSLATTSNSVTVSAIINMSVDVGISNMVITANDVSVVTEFGVIVTPTPATFTASVNSVLITFHTSYQTFPSDVCVIQEGYSQELTQSIKCLGGSYSAGKTIINATVMFDNNEQMNDFYYWWINEAGRGADDFTIDLPVMGIRRDWIAKITDNFTTTMLTAYVRKIPFKFELQENIMEYLPLTSYGFVYPEELGCIVVDGYTETSGSSMSYCLGKTNVRKVNEVMVGKIMLTDAASLSKLVSWYVNELSYGNESFTVSLPFMGTTAVWSVKFIDTLVQSLISGQIGTVAIKLEMLDYLPTAPV